MLPQMKITVRGVLEVSRARLYEEGLYSVPLDVILMWRSNNSSCVIHKSQHTELNFIDRITIAFNWLFMFCFVFYLFIWAAI